MSILLADLDNQIISFLDLPEYVSLMQTNIYYYQKIKSTNLIIEWNKMKINDHKDYIVNNIFHITCQFGYITYAKSLINRYDIDIHSEFEYAFFKSCANGDIETAKWLIDLGENHGYGKINIIIDRNPWIRLIDPWRSIFAKVCMNGHMEIAKWLIDLGENHGYGKIDIHFNYSFILSCKYGRINIHESKYDFIESNLNAFIDSHYNGHTHITDWLIDLGENHGYGKYDLNNIPKMALLDF